MTAARLVRTAVVLVLPVAFFGCGSAPGDVAVSSSSGSGGSGASDVAQVRSAGSVAPRTGGLTLPLDAYALTAAEDQVLARAAEAQVRQCAESFGLDASATGPLPFGTTAQSQAAAVTRHDRRYSVVDAEVAATYGYHPPTTTDVRREFYEAHTDAELEILVGVTADGSRSGRAGVPEDGCLGEAARASAGADGADRAGLRAGEELVSDVQAGAWHAAMADPRVVEAFAAWSSCMAGAGFQYAAPMEANDDPRWWVSETAGSDEIATAVADVSCKSSTGLVAVWSAVEAEHQAELIAANQAELDAYRALLDQQVAAAR
jgi:hypothetical protein